MVKATAVDVFELSRFVLSGIFATLGNLAAVWLVRFFATFETALVAGIVAGLTISFTFSKLFVFNSPSWRRSGGEAVRFVIVYTGSCVAYLAVAVVIHRCGLLHGIASGIAEGGAILVGAGTMVLTSYFGHRFFTYRTYRSVAEHLGER